MIASPENMTGVFDEDRDWLANQPNMQPWEQGCEDLVKQMAAWIEQHTGNFCEAAIGADSKNYANYESRVWQCWRHHWKEAVEASPNQPVDGCKLAGAKENLLCDVILVEAILQRNDEALHYFQNGYFDDNLPTYLRRWGARIAPRFAHDLSWWDDMLPTFFLPVEDKKERFASFIGKGNLKAWLRTVIFNALIKPVGDPHVDDKADVDQSGEDAADNVTISTECFNLLVEFLHDLLGRVDPRVRTALFMKSEGLGVKEIGEVISRDKGTVSRMLTNFTQSARERMQAVEERATSISQELRECVDQLTGSGVSLFDLLRDFFEPGQGAED